MALKSCPECNSEVSSSATTCSQCGYPFVTNSKSNMILTNLESIPGRSITEHLGLVQGSTVRAKHAGRDFMASLKNIFGGELKGYTELLQESREESIKRMTEQAQSIGADAVLNIRFSTSSVTQGASELFIYGTAVKLD